MNAHRLVWLLPMLALLILTGCGGSSGGTTVAEGGISGTGISAGMTQGFGSIIVNESVHETETAEFFREGVEINGTSEVRDVFEIGEVVRVDWSDDNGTRRAERVSYESELKGPVTRALDPATRTVGVLGQQVVYDEALTTFLDSNGNSLPGVPALDACDIVEVSGFRTADGNGVRATLIKVEDPTTEFRLNGVVDLSDGASFTIGGLTIDAGGTAVPSSGDFVRVRGILSGSCNPITGEITGAVATSVEVRSFGISAQDGAEVEIEALVSAIPSVAAPGNADFDLAGIPVAITPSTVFEGGVAAGLAVNIRVEVEGELNALGVLVADKVEFEDEIKLESEIVGTPSDGDLELEFGAGVGERILVKTNALTDFDGLSFADLGSGDHVLVEGYIDGDGAVVVATELSRDDGKVGERVLEGPVSGFTLDSITILDIVIDTSGLDDADFQRDDTVIGRAAFFDALQPGVIVKAQGDEIAGNEIDWKELELED